MKKVILSIGSLTVGEVQRMDNGIFLFYCYDPCPSVYAKFCETFRDNKNVICFPDAVSFYNGKANLNLNGTESELVDYKSNLTTEVKVISLQNVVSMVLTEQSLDCELNLLLNCEGEEISIIMGTPIDLLKGFKRIKIEFHPHLYNESAMFECVKKLSQHFGYSAHCTLVKKLPVYIFER
jgi:hypothetical protein